MELADLIEGGSRWWAVVVTVIEHSSCMNLEEFQDWELLSCEIELCCMQLAIVCISQVVYSFNLFRILYGFLGYHHHHHHHHIH